MIEACILPDVGFEHGQAHEEGFARSPAEQNYTLRSSIF